MTGPASRSATARSKRWPSIADGATVLVGGFGSAGQPVALIEALLEGGASELTVVSNNAGNGDDGLAALMREGRVRKVICSFPRQSDSWLFDAAWRAGSIELELVPQGTLAERIRAAGAGIGAFFTPTGFGTPLAEGKETRMIDGRELRAGVPDPRRFRPDRGAPGRRAGQPGLPQDRAQLRPDHGDRRDAPRSSQVDEIVPVGALDPEHVVTPVHLRRPRSSRVEPRPTPCREEYRAR